MRRLTLLSWLSIVLLGLGLAALVLLTAACKTLTREQLVVTLTNARWGLSEACDQEWVSPPDCGIGLAGLTTAIDSAQHAAPAVLKSDVVSVLQATTSSLPSDSHALAWLTYLVVFLEAA